MKAETTTTKKIRTKRTPRVAVARGVGFVRVFFVIIVSAFIVRIGGEVLGLWA